MRGAVRALLLAAIFAVALPACANAATADLTVTDVTFNAAPGEKNTAVIAYQGAGFVFIGDQNPDVTVNPGSGTTTCITIPEGLGLPKGLLCWLLLPTTFTMNLGDEDDTGVINGVNGSSSVAGVINGGPGDDLMAGGKENDEFHGGTGSDTAAYAGVDAASITRTTPVTASLPQAPATSTSSNGQAGENDKIFNDVEGLVGGNGDDTLTGNSQANTIAGAAPPGTPSVVTSPAGNDTIDGGGGDDTLVGGDTGSVSGGTGNDQIVGGRSTSGTTLIYGGPDDDTLISGLGNDSIFGDSGSNILAYASVVQGGLTVVDRGTDGVTASLPADGQTSSGGKTGGPEQDTIHDDIGTLVGSNGDDVLTGSPGNDTIVGVAPAGTPGVAPGPSGNDKLYGGDGVDILLGAEGNDLLQGDGGSDVISAGAGDDRVEARDGNAESPTCGDGIDTAIVDAIDTPATDCETVDGGPTTPPQGGSDTTAPVISLAPKKLTLGKGRRVSLTVACPNEPSGCSGTLILTTARKFATKPGGKAKKPYRLGRSAFTTAGTGPAQVTVKLSKATLRLVKRGKSIGLKVSATATDASANTTQKTLRRSLKRKR